MEIENRLFVLLLLGFILASAELWLGPVQRYFYRAPARDWSEIGWPYRFGRILLMVLSIGVFAVFLALWLLP
jgi:hypothetical protein